MTKEELKKGFLKKSSYAQAHSELWDGCCMIFVYNSVTNCQSGDLHISECVYDDEVALIEDAFHAFHKLPFLKFDDEETFISQAPLLRKQYENIYVYSMAQNLEGVGRRALIPLICEYYGFINIASDARSSILGGDKELMHTLLAKFVPQPDRIFLTTLKQEEIVQFFIRHPICLIKPNSESASIGIQRIELHSDADINSAMEFIKEKLKLYKKIILEEFIVGQEIECTVIPWGNGIYISDPVEIIKSTEYLDYDTVLADRYGFKIFESCLSGKIRSLSDTAYRALRFNSIARFDFMVRGSEVFLFDITPNPTISECSSASTAVDYIAHDPRIIYEILLLKELFIPSLDETE